MYIVVRNIIKTKICGVFTTQEAAERCIQRNIDYFNEEYERSVEECIVHYHKLLEQNTLSNTELELMQKQLEHDTQCLSKIKSKEMIPSVTYNLLNEFQIVYCELNQDYVESETRILKSLEINQNNITISERDLKMFQSVLANTMLPSTEPQSRKRKWLV